MVTVLLAVGSAALFGGGVALQQRPFDPSGPPLPDRLRWMVVVVRRPWWLAGVLAEMAGFVVQIAALRHGSLVEVQPVIALSLLFTLALAARWSPVTMGPTQWSATVAIVGGLAAFLALARPEQPTNVAVATASWVTLGLAAGAGVLLAVVLAYRWRDRLRAALLALAAGTGDAVMATLTKQLANESDRGLHHVVVSPVLYLLCLVGMVAFWLSQNAYRAGHQTVSLPIISVTDPILASVLGVVIFGEVVHLHGVQGPLALVAAAAMVGGLVVLNRTAPAGGAGPTREQRPHVPSPVERSAGSVRQHSWSPNSLRPVPEGADVPGTEQL